jgi:two-component system, NtrC family, sensor kinase
MEKLKSFYFNTLEWLDNKGTAFHHTPEEKRKTSILIRASMLTGIFMILYIGNCLYTGFELGYYILPIEALIFLSLPFLIQYGLSPKIVGHLFIINGVGFGILLVAFSGGLQSPVTPWLTLMPICAILFLDSRNAWIWAFIILAIVLAMGVYWMLIGPFPIQYNLDKSPFYFLNCYAGLIFIYLTLSLIFEKRLNATITELETNKLSLEESNTMLNTSISNLKKAQAQLVQAEKMASLGELTAGIAHEIKNPLNFVNNFAELNRELLTDLKLELDKGNTDEVLALISDLDINLEKINHHGKRADSIVKSMLQHSHVSTSEKELTDVNSLIDEYVRLSFHGYKAKEKSFNADLQLNFDPELPKVKIVSLDIGRVFLNIINNAFYAINKRAIASDYKDYKPFLKVVTFKEDDHVVIRIADNGTGMSETIRTKIFQPFFTTKPAGEGTGLGMSLSYDVVTKAHGGNLSVESKEGEGTEFTMRLPI